MQSGMAQTKKWVLELEYDMAKSIEPLMGWTGSSDTNSQVQLWFESKEVAINYAKKNGIPFTVLNDNSRKHIIRENGYGDNFSFNKKVVTPVYLKPYAIAQFIGAAPLNSGSKEACKLKVP